MNDVKIDMKDLIILTFCENHTSINSCNQCPFGITRTYFTEKGEPFQRDDCMIGYPKRTLRDQEIMYEILATCAEDLKYNVEDGIRKIDNCTNEQAVVRKILKDPQMMTWVLQAGINESTFEEQQSKKIFKAMKNLYDAGEEITIGKTIDQLFIMGERDIDITLFSRRFLYSTIDDLFCKAIKIFEKTGNFKWKGDKENEEDQVYHLLESSNEEE